VSDCFLVTVYYYTNIYIAPYAELQRWITIKQHFHYGCVLHCVAFDIEMPIVFLFPSQHEERQCNSYSSNAMLCRALVEISL